MKGPRCILLTGATGFLGAQVARRLLSEPDLVILALVRASDRDVAARRLARAWWDWPELAKAVTNLERVEILPGDVSLPRLGLDGQTYARVASSITHIFHAAADLRIEATLSELRQTNLQGTTNVLDLARLARLTGRLQRYAHVSTAYVAGRRNGVISEADLIGDHGFASAYEQSKFEAECLVQAAKKELPVSVFRPGMIVGSSKTGEIRTFNTIYYPLRLYLSGKLPLLPARRALPVNLVPVDYVADAITRLSFDPEAEGLTFHLTAPTESLPRAGELVEFVRDWARKTLGRHLPLPFFCQLPLPKQPYQSNEHLASDRGFSSHWKLPWKGLNNMLALMPYFKGRKEFLRDNADRLLGAYSMDWREFLPRLLGYAVDHGFLHRTERTVHEQLLARLSSKTRPVRFFDIVKGKVISRNAGDLRRDILAAAGALTSLGIQPGDRVAITGLNSTRSLILDAAIGLVGAVSVPLYYTCPPVEIDAILGASGARLLFVGAPKIIERLGEIQSGLPVVSFWREPVSEEVGREVLSWENFIALGQGRTDSIQAPVGFGDLATLRYTSGTTGMPKGVSFEHRHLRWMGETMASLLPWQARTQPARYVSFLPTSHVVEGILATYAPYYLPIPVSIYYLEDLKSVGQTLPRLRPSIFFSVPRIYEKIWEALEQNPLGRYYVHLPEGMWKRALGMLLRWQTLCKAGLDRCIQLIAGSAPCSEIMLRNFRELGIEIHNAYGQTEAPLVTLNQWGENRLGTVGQPLPQTEIRVAGDGEVLVRGPQVMTGYFGGQEGSQPEQPFHDGWLLTGDLGSITPEGSLILSGRKKELIKTSYGKYIQPAKIESLLREIPGVAEAMLVGEERPYCVALLWLQNNNLEEGEGARIDHLVGQVNRSLSHPEQVKRWAVLANDLSIERGDLTANLKLKRQTVARRLRDVLESLYNGLYPSGLVLYTGEAERS